MSIKTKKQIYYLEYSNSDRELVHHFNKLVDSFVEIIEKELTLYTCEDLEDFRKELLKLSLKEMASYREMEELKYYASELEEKLGKSINEKWELEDKYTQLQNDYDEVKDERDLYKSKVDRYEED